MKSHFVVLLSGLFAASLLWSQSADTDGFSPGATSRRADSGYVRGCAVSDSHPALAASFWPKLHQLTKGGHDQIRMCKRLRMSNQC